MKASSVTSRLLSDRTMPDRPTKTFRFIFMFCVLCLLFALGQFHRSSGSVLAPVLIDEFSLNAQQIGMIMGSMFLAQGLIQIPFGLLIHRYGCRIIMASTALIAVAGSLLITYASGWTSILAGRFLLGIGFAASLLGAYTVFVKWGEPRNIASLTGRFLFFGSVGGLFATAPFAYMIEIFSWRMVFLFIGIATLTMAIAAYVSVRDVPPSLETKNKTSEPITLRNSIVGLLSIMKDRRIWPALSISLFMYAPLQVLIGLWAGPFLKDVHHLSAIDRSYILFAMAVGMNIGMLIYAPIEQYFNTRRKVILSAMTFISALFIFLAAIGYAQVWVAVSLFIVITVSAPFFVLVLAHTQALFDAEYASRVVSLVNLLAISGIFVMQYLTGFLISLMTDDPNVTGSTLGYRLVFASVGVVFFIMMLSYRRTQDIPPKG